MNFSCSLHNEVFLCVCMNVYKCVHHKALGVVFLFSWFWCCSKQAPLILFVMLHKFILFTRLMTHHIENAFDTGMEILMRMNTNLYSRVDVKLYDFLKSFIN